MDLYRAKIYNNGVLVRDFIPVKNPSHVLGLYDLVKNVFYPKSGGTNDFIAGPVVNIVTILGEQVGVKIVPPTEPYLTARYNNNTYYIKLSENDYSLHIGSSNKLRIITSTGTYNAHDESVE